MNVGLSRVISLPKGASVTFLSEASQHSSVAQQECVSPARRLQAPSGGPRRVISRSSLRRRVTGRARLFRNNYNALCRDKYRQGWLSQLRDKETELRDKETELRDKETELRDKETELRDKETELRDKETELREANSQIAELREKAEKLKAREQKYRHVFLKNVGPPKISSDDMQQAFAKLKQRLEIVARNKMLNLCVPRRRLLRGASGTTRTMYDLFRSADNSLRPLILQAELFKLLLRRILTVNHFGVGQALNASQSQPLFEDTMERMFQKSERSFTRQSVDEGVIADWRLSTIKCIELSGMGQPDETAANEAILTKLGSFMPKFPDAEAVCAMHTDVGLLCEAAYDFRLMMRKSKDIYTCFLIPGGAPWHEHSQNSAEVFGEQPGGSSGQVVAYTFWGGLSKHAEFKGEERVVLQKAQVILTAA